MVSESLPDLSFETYYLCNSIVIAAWDMCNRQQLVIFISAAYFRGAIDTNPTTNFGASDKELSVPHENFCQARTPGYATSKLTP